MDGRMELMYRCSTIWLVDFLTAKVIQLNVASDNRSTLLIAPTPPSSGKGWQPALPT